MDKVVVLFTMEGCPFCVDLKNMLKEENISHQVKVSSATEKILIKSDIVILDSYFQRINLSELNLAKQNFPDSTTFFASPEFALRKSTKK